MKRFLIIVLIGGLLVTVACAQRSLIRNGSFEADGGTIADVNSEPAMYWCDVNTTSDWLFGGLGTAGVTHGDYSLTLSSGVTTLDEGDVITVSQDVFLESDVSFLSFDLVLTSGWPGYFPWDPNLRSLFIAINDQVVWTSDNVELDSNGGFTGPVEVNEFDLHNYLNDDWHKLTIGLRVNQTHFSEMDYFATVDWVKFDKYCGGLGFLDFDFNHDCYVNMGDFAILADVWMEDANIAREDIFEDGVINGLDMAMLAEDWLFNTDWKFWGQDGTFEMERLENDWDMSGRIDVGELLILSEYWLSDGSCAGVELAGDETIINFEDFAVLVEQWGMKDWLYFVD